MREGRARPGVSHPSERVTQTVRLDRRARQWVGVVTAALLTPPGIRAAQPFWQEIAIDAESVAEVDAASIRVRDGALTAWVRRTLSSGASFKDRTYRSVIALTVFDCESKKSGVSSTTAFSGPRGEGRTVQIDEGLPVSVAPLTHPRPGSAEYRVLEFVCEFKEQLESGGEDAARKYLEAAEAAAKAEREAARAKRLNPASAPARITRPANPADHYPADARRRGEQGAPVVEVCVGPSGEPVRQPRVTETSGFPEIDAAAISVAKANRYAPGRENGEVLPESCLKFRVRFALGADR